MSGSPREVIQHMALLCIGLEYQSLDCRGADWLMVQLGKANWWTAGTAAADLKDYCDNQIPFSLIVRSHQLMTRTCWVATGKCNVPHGTYISRSRISFFRFAISMHIGGAFNVRALCKIAVSCNGEVHLREEGWGCEFDEYFLRRPTAQASNLLTLSYKYQRPGLIDHTH